MKGLKGNDECGMMNDEWEGLKGNDECGMMNDEREIGAAFVHIRTIVEANGKNVVL